MGTSTVNEKEIFDKQEKGPEPTDREEVKRILQQACDRDWEDETLYQTAVIASNAIYWRDREIENLRKDLAKALANHSADLSATLPTVDDLDRRLSEIANDCKAKDHYLLHGLWRAREEIKAMKSQYVGEKPSA
jgi:hypothetical protein